MADRKENLLRQEEFPCLIWSESWDGVTFKRHEVVVKFGAGI